MTKETTKYGFEQLKDRYSSSAAYPQCKGQLLELPKKQENTPCRQYNLRGRTNRICNLF